MELARERIVRLYKFVAALYDRRNPVVRQMNDHEWILRFSDIPDHPSITLTQFAEVDDSETNEAEGDDSPDVFLRCKRPPVTAAPAKPDALRDWLGREWDDCRTDDPQPLESRNVGHQEGGNILFTDDPVRVELLNEYFIAWQRWAANERIALNAGAIFEKLYALHGKLQREAERYELVLADGILVWYRPDGGVRHPLLLRPMRLEFDADAEVAEFRIIDAGATTEFYSSLFRSMTDVDGRAIGALRTEAEQLEPHPLGTGDTDGFLRSVAMALSANGQYTRDGVPSVERAEPVIGRAPCFLLRKRTSGVARAIDAIAEDAMSAAQFAQALCNIVGRPVLEVLDEAAADQTSITASGPLSLVDANEDANVLFTKPANVEQLEIARRLEQHDCVLVQGPPGTGKTHTIANLLGHLLAKGKSVLVCSHTTKALKVLREKVVPELQPLCVSVMDAPEDDQALKSSVGGIVERLSSTDHGQLSRDMTRFEAERTATITEAQNVRMAILNARLEEQHPVIVGGESTAVIDAAKEIAAGIGTHDWVPGPVTQGEPLPLTYNELADLYATTGQVSVQDEQSLLHALPAPSALPTPVRFHALMSERVELAEVDETFRRDLWGSSGNESAEELDGALTACQDALTLIIDRPEWTRRIVNDGAATDLEQRGWLALLQEVDATYKLCMEAKDTIVLYGPQLCAEVPEDRALEIYSAIAKYVHEKGGAPSFLTLLTRREWKKALDGATLMGGRKPRLREHFDALATAAKVHAQREVLRRRWQAQVASAGGPAWDDSDTVEATCRRYSDLISSSLEWHSSVWKSVQQSLYDVGLRWDLLIGESNSRYAEYDAFERLQRIVDEQLPQIMAAERARRRMSAILGELERASVVLARDGDSPTAVALRSGIDSYDSEKYRKAYDELMRLRSVSERGRMRADLLRRLERCAPGWAAAIRARKDEHGTPDLPGDPYKAWRWRQFTQDLDRREATSIPELTNKLEHLRQSLRRTTAELVDRKAWLAQLQRTTLEQRQALMGFALAKRKIGRGTGKRAATLARMARDLMSKARSAVPVWIMPIVKAAEVFDPRNTKFDVVIVDEASQSDVTGLVVVYLGRQTIVVGDDEQVSPAAVGEKVADSQHLVDEFLEGIPNSQLYDGKQSLYDLASASFGGDICLLEHFRCVPDIIRFSNALSYGGKIRPLREATPELPTPAVVAHRVASPGTVDGKINEVEARTVSSLVAAAAEQLEYYGRTFGVISMVGDDQAYRIENILRTLLPPNVIESRRLLCGSAAQFQGDERNVMFLSMVQVASGTPLPMLQERTAQQRFNVAASRAQDQMWVVYSLDPATELKAGDLRRRLIEHAIDPSKLSNAEAVALDKAESPFEVEVIRRLSAAGYYVQSQYPVGAFRIDIVVNGAGKKRLAVECDGERFHRIEDLQQDADRQAILERLGWTFCRIRGSSFYRNPDAAMQHVFDRLKSMDILPFDGGAETVETTASSGLISRVRARAAEIFETIDVAPMSVGRARQWKASR